MFWTKVSKALSDIIMIVALVMALMLAEGLGKILDSFMAGMLGFVVGIVISVGAGVALKSLTRTSASFIKLLDKMEGNIFADRTPQSLEDIEEYERESEEKEKEKDEDIGDTSAQNYVNGKWKRLPVEIKLVWIDVIVMLVGTVFLSYKASSFTQYGAMLILGFGLVVNMVINAIIGTAVENHYKLERINYLIRTRNIRKRQ